MPMLTTSVILLAGGALASPEADRRRRSCHGVEHGVTSAHDVAAIERAPSRRQACRSAVCSTARCSVMLIFSPENIASRPLFDAGGFGTLREQLHRSFPVTAHFDQSSSRSPSTSRSSRSARDRPRRRHACRRDLGAAWCRCSASSWPGSELSAAGELRIGFLTWGRHPSAELFASGCETTDRVFATAVHPSCVGGGLGHCPKDHWHKSQR